MDEAIEAVRRAENIVVLTGAGMSVESGIAPFRGEDGLWNEFDPQEMASVTGFRRHPEKCWNLFRLQIEECLDAEPHEGYSALVEMEDQGLYAVITQNVDGLHQKAGSENVLELHGTLNQLVCDSCGERKETEELVEDILSGETPRCECGKVMRPNVVLFGEPLPAKILEKSWSAVEKCDLLMSVGTSAVVQPAASLPSLAKRKGATVVEINVEKTPLTPRADHFLEGKAGQVLPEVLERS
ncbi:MAG: SIR2 family NAD-dependent protein deacylase [Candidatus Natronoplasma sp.]